MAGTAESGVPEERVGCATDPPENPEEARGAPVGSPREGVPAEREGEGAATEREEVEVTWVGGSGGANDTREPVAGAGEDTEGAEGPPEGRRVRD